MTIDVESTPLRNRRTRIVATLGPASDDETTIAALVDVGVDLFRLNMSHGDHSGHAATLARIDRGGSPVPAPLRHHDADAARGAAPGRRRLARVDYCGTACSAMPAPVMSE